MKRTCVILSLVTVLSSCGLIERLSGSDGEQEQQTKQSLNAGDPIPHETLSQLLPQVEGWNAAPPEGKSNLIGNTRISAASRKYEKEADGKRSMVSLEIVDGNHVSSVYAPFALMAHSQGATVDVHKMRIDIDGHPGIQEWKPEAGNVVVLLLVARRFMVTLRGSHISPPTVRQYLEGIDLKQLTSWAGAATPSGTSPPSAAP